MSTRVIAIGEALVEIMRLEGSGSLDHSGTFVGPFASGAPAIFAVAIARLGLKSDFIGCVGADAFGRLLRSRLQAEGVDTTLLKEHPKLATGVAFIAYQPDGNREFVFHIAGAAAGALSPDDLLPDYFNGINWLHISGSTASISDDCFATCLRAMELTLSAGGRISFDPNLRPELLPVSEARGRLAPFLEACYLLLPTASEALLLSDTDDEGVAGAVLRGNADRLVVFKRGAQGCTIFSQQGRFDAPGFSVEEVDPTGAGDCFNAACLLGAARNWPVEQIARYANAAGALAVTRQGPMEGAPTPDQIEALMRR
jgi:sugar/nucleoside kinase (ribokinase family)